MKICITAKGETLDSPVEERFGRAPVFIFFETESEEAIAVPNEFAQAAGSPAGREGLIVAAKAMAMTAVDLLAVPENVEQVRAAFEEWKAGQTGAD